MADDPCQGQGPPGNFQHLSWKEWINSTEKARCSTVRTGTGLGISGKKAAGKENSSFRGQQTRLTSKEKNPVKTVLSPHS